jgi:cytochrome c peroxidase
MMKPMMIAGFLLLAFCVLIQADPSPKKPKLTSAGLGEKLFSDVILSRDQTISCASCHDPKHAFADPRRFSVGVRGQVGDRNAPSVMNMSLRPTFFWDGRSPTLEAQALEPIKNPIEMDLSIAEAVRRLNKSRFYKKAFQEVYGKLPNDSLLGKALADFERTLETTSPYDAYMNGDTNAISASAKRGLLVFNEKGKCFDCHFADDLTGDEFRNVGLFNNQNYKDVGRFAITKDSADLGKFKVPSLRNVALTAPYFHDGSFKTLREVIDYYNTPDKFVPNAINRDTLLQKPLLLTESEIVDLENFLQTLTKP